MGSVVAAVAVEAKEVAGRAAAVLVVVATEVVALGVAVRVVMGVAEEVQEVR